MEFRVVREYEKESGVKVKVEVKAPERKFGNDPAIVFNNQEKVVDFLIKKGYSFNNWKCLKAETVTNVGESESSRVKTWSFLLEKTKAKKTVSKTKEKAENVTTEPTTKTRRRRATTRKKQTTEKKD